MKWSRNAWMMLKCYWSTIRSKDNKLKMEIKMIIRTKLKEKLRLYIENLTLGTKSNKNERNRPNLMPKTTTFPSNFVCNSWFLFSLFLLPICLPSLFFLCFLLALSRSYSSFLQASITIILKNRNWVFLFNCEYVGIWGK